MTTFETGKTYYYRFACNTDTAVKCTITKRTAKTITFKEDDGEVKTRRIYIYGNCENVSLGRYSMAPILSAERSA